MRSMFAILSFLLTISSAQTVLPTCANLCITTAISQTTCLLTDYACLCQSKAYGASVQSCIQTSCSAADAQSSFSYISQVCKGVGVTLTGSSSAIASVTASSAVASAVRSSLSAQASSASASAASALSSVSASVASLLSSATASASASASSSSNSSSSSNGKIIGIGVGVGIAALIIIGAILWWFIAKRRKSASSRDNAKLELAGRQGGHHGGGDKIGVVSEVDEKYPPAGRHEQDHLLEMEAMQKRTAELEAQHRVNEQKAAQQQLMELEARQKAFEISRMRHERDQARMGRTASGPYEVQG